MAHIAELSPAKGERVITFGGTRSGKSALADMVMMHVQHVRPSAMQILVDTKPRYRAEKERGPFRRGRRDAAYRYETWEKGPTIPNSTVIDIWDDKPFQGLWKNPGEIAIMQGAEFDDWRRMLLLLKGFVNAQIKGVERRIIVDECLDFTTATHSALTRKTMYSTGRHGRERKGALELISTHIASTDFRLSSCKWHRGSIYFTCEQMRTCGTYVKSESGMLNPQRETGYSGSIRYSRAVPCPSHSRVKSTCPNGTHPSYRIRKRMV